MADPTLDLKSATVLAGQLGHLNVAAPTDVMGVWRGAAGAQKIGDVQVVALMGHSRLLWGGTAGGGTNAQTITTAGMPPGGLVAGDQLRWICNAVNSGAVTVAIDGGTPIPLTAGDATPLHGYELSVGMLLDGIYDGTRIRLLNPIPYMVPRVSLIGQPATSFLAIPARCQRIELQTTSLSTSGSSAPIFQFGTSAGFVVSGYQGRVVSPGNGSVQNSIGALISYGWSSGKVTTGWFRMQLHNQFTNRWIFAGMQGREQESLATSDAFGYVDLPARLDRIRITTLGGTDTIDSGAMTLIGE